MHMLILVDNLKLAWLPIYKTLFTQQRTFFVALNTKTRENRVLDCFFDLIEYLHILVILRPMAEESTHLEWILRCAQDDTSPPIQNHLQATPRLL